MNVKKFKNKLTHNTSLIELEEYVVGIKKIDHRTGTKKEKAELLNVFIPKLIEHLVKENAEDIKFWYNAPLFRLAFQYCLQNRRPKSDLFDVALEIIRKVEYDSKNLRLKNKFRTYYHRTKGVEII